MRRYANRGIAYDVEWGTKKKPRTEGIPPAIELEIRLKCIRNSNSQNPAEIWHSYRCLTIANRTRESYDFRFFNVFLSFHRFAHIFLVLASLFDTVSLKLLLNKMCFRIQPLLGVAHSVWALLAFAFVLSPGAPEYSMRINHIRVCGTAGDCAPESREAMLMLPSSKSHKRNWNFN